MVTILVAAGAAVLATVFTLWLVRRKESAPEMESRLMSRLDGVLESMSRWREESRTAVQDKITELYGALDRQNRASRTESTQTLETATRLLADRFEALQLSNEEKLREIRQEVEKKLTETIEQSGKTFDTVTSRLSDLRVTNERIMEFSRDLHELQNILRAPRMRGEVGEIEMERLLRDCLAPEQFAIQYELNGNRVDAVIFNPEGLLPIDSKFPLEAWRRVHQGELSEGEREAAKRDFTKAVKGHIQDIASKYLQPPKTLDFAVMYVPAEGVYYEVIESAELSEFARVRRVFPASPMTFWALLQVTVIGFRGLRISENAQHIAGMLSAMQDDVQKFRDAFERAVKQMGFARSNLEEAAGHLERLDVKLMSMNSMTIDTEDGIASKEVTQGAPRP
jgi:DNA recombination protein RmuC